MFVFIHYWHTIRRQEGTGNQLASWFLVALDDHSDSCKSVFAMFFMGGREADPQKTGADTRRTGGGHEADPQKTVLDEEAEQRRTPDSRKIMWRNPHTPFGF